MRQAGFTLVELVVVIVLLSILASFAIPRFIDLRADARGAVIAGLAGSMRSASALAHAKSFVTGVFGNSEITMEGQVVGMSNFYPSANDQGISAAMQDMTGFSLNQVSATVADFVIPEAKNSGGNCKVTYTAAGVGESPIVTSVTSACQGN